MIIINNQDKNDDTKIMADLLRSGNTMLNLACPVCNNPLFRNKDGDTFCPICKRKVIIEKDENHDKYSDKKQDSRDYTKVLLNKNEIKLNLNALIGILEKQINYISQKLESENQIELIEHYVVILENIYDFLKKLRNDNASAGI